MTDPIKAKIQELCPDVMELKFGCAAQFFYQEDWRSHELTANYLPAVVYFAGKNADGKNTYWSETHDTLALNEDKMYGYKILGSPITLAVVLRAIKEHTNAHAVKESEDNDYLDLVSVMLRWNLSQDTYDAQSQETKDFIGSLLGV